MILQTSLPEHSVIGQVIRNDYAAMYKLQTEERRLFKYPPYFRMIQITLRHKDVQVVKQAAFAMGNSLRAVFGSRVLGPIDPPVSRIQNLFIKQIILKFEAEASPAKAKEILQDISDQLLAEARFKSVRIGLDVDPM